MRACVRACVAAYVFSIDKIHVTLKTIAEFGCDLTKSGAT